MKPRKKSVVPPEIPQNIVEGTDAEIIVFGFPTLAETITKELNEFSGEKNAPKIATLYKATRQLIKVFREYLEKRLSLRKVLPELPPLSEKDWYASTVVLIKYCEKAVNCLCASKQIPWIENTPDYLLLTKAIPRLADGGIPLKTLGKTLIPTGPMRYMRKGKRCKVHIGDFRQWWENKEKKDPDAERILEALDKRKEHERKQK